MKCFLVLAMLIIGLAIYLFQNREAKRFLRPIPASVEPSPAALERMRRDSMYEDRMSEAEEEAKRQRNGD